MPCVVTKKVAHWPQEQKVWPLSRTKWWPFSLPGCQDIKKLISQSSLDGSTGICRHPGYQAAELSKFIASSQGFLSTCVQMCQTTANCLAFMYRHADRTCYMYSTKERKKTNIPGLEFFEFYCGSTVECLKRNYTTSSGKSLGILRFSAGIPKLLMYQDCIKKCRETPRCIAISFSKYAVFRTTIINVTDCSIYQLLVKRQLQTITCQLR